MPAGEDSEPVRVDKTDPIKSQRLPIRQSWVAEATCQRQIGDASQI
jgi:hypothetical protein